MRTPSRTVDRPPASLRLDCPLCSSEQRAMRRAAAARSPSAWNERPSRNRDRPRRSPVPMILDNDHNQLRKSSARLTPCPAYHPVSRSPPLDSLPTEVAAQRSENDRRVGFSAQRAVHGGAGGARRSVAAVGATSKLKTKRHPANLLGKTRPKLGYMAGDLDAGRQAFEKRAWRSATCLLAESHGAATPGEVWR